MRLVDLEPQFLKWISDTQFRSDATFTEADGIMFLCPKCFIENKGPIGTHVVICWKPHVPQSTFPRPGRWEQKGTGVSDLSLVAGSSSVLLTGGPEVQAEAASFFTQRSPIEQVFPRLETATRGDRSSRTLLSSRSRSTPGAGSEDSTLQRMAVGKRSE